MKPQREIPWPGNQINDINQFRHDCYYQCHLENPTDSGWYEKTDACGQACKKALQEYEYLQGKNPCELKLQAPVFWYEHGHRPLNPTKSYENYQQENSYRDVENATTTLTIDKMYIIMYIIMIVLIVFYIMLYILLPLV